MTEGAEPRVRRSALRRQLPLPLAPRTLSVVLALSALATACAARAERLAPCRSQPERALWVSPREPRVGEPLRVLALAERDAPTAHLALLGPAGWERFPTARGGGPPFWWSAELPSPSRPARLQLALLGEGDEPLVCLALRLGARRADRPGRPEFVAPAGAGAPWPLRAAWGWSTEALYAAWIERLFAAPADERPSWSPLHQVLRDARRNWLYNHLGLAEDGPDPVRAVVAQPDCADLPYFLRAYFAWKLGLPFGWRHCDRGSAARPARCGPLREAVLGQPTAAAGASAAQAFSRLLREQLSLVHSGAGRTAGDDDATDLYPVALTRAALRPGTVYVDPYGHLLVIARWEAQGPRGSGVLYAVDGHPDLSVGRKRFWRGAFLFVPGAEGGSGGFKAFRPLRVRDGLTAALTNDELGRERGFAAPSLEQYALGTDAFYARMEALINPRPLGPEDALRERMRALHELMLERVEAVAVGEQYLRTQGGREIAMPEGPRIFESRGPWEDFSTPARDLRLLLAIDETVGFPAYVARHPERFAWPAGLAAAAVAAALERLLAQGTAAAVLSYQRSDGAQQRLTVAEVIARRQALELAYNPNDCIELRWGARGAELASCQRHAPSEQRERMAQYRPWFARRQRPPLR
ncbi:MAG: hypothetical protein IPG96_07000 [Proteobacteria bacterium]|nr:hypothetical protein [Pseudomonadota bacterium]